MMYPLTDRAPQPDLQQPKQKLDQLRFSTDTVSDKHGQGSIDLIMVTSPPKHNQSTTSSTKLSKVKRNTNKVHIDLTGNNN